MPAKPDIIMDGTGALSLITTGIWRDVYLSNTRDDIHIDGTRNYLPGNWSRRKAKMEAVCTVMSDEDTEEQRLRWNMIRKRLFVNK